MSLISSETFQVIKKAALTCYSIIRYIDQRIQKKVISHLIGHSVEQSVVGNEDITIRDHPHLQSGQEELPLMLSTNQDGAHAHDDHWRGRGTIKKSTDDKANVFFNGASW